VFKVPLTVQVDPLYNSVCELNGAEFPPPKITPEVCVPAPAKANLPVFIVPLAVQVEPL
jgi:hypothetical protein